MQKSRLEAFSDGVFAIVITLLILDIRFPEVEYSHFAETMLSVLPRIFAYVMSFIIIGIYWISHHNSFYIIKKIDRPFLWLNILLLLCISFIPFPTSLLGRYPFEADPIIFYGATLITCNLIGYIMILYVYYHPHLASEQFSKQYLRSHTPSYIIVNSAYIIAIVISHWLPLLSYIIYAGIAIIIITIFPLRNDGINYLGN